VEKMESLLTFMDKAAGVFPEVAPNVTDLKPVIYHGNTPARKLEMIYSRWVVL